jgi:hypothetical protein
MIPHERSLVTRMKNKPFTLLGVNSDRDPGKLKLDLASNRVNWRSFKNQRPQLDPISKTYQVKGFPTLFLIDHKGVIRQKWVGNPGDAVLDQVIDALVREAEADLAQKKKAG